MSAVLTSMAKFESGQKAVLIRRGNVAKGTLRCLRPPLDDGDTVWMLSIGYGREAAITLTKNDAVYPSSPARCFACTRPGDDTPPGGGGEGCGVCFDGYL